MRQFVQMMTAPKSSPYQVVESTVNFYLILHEWETSPIAYLNQQFFFAQPDVSINKLPKLLTENRREC